MAALTEEQTLIKDQAQAWTSEQAPVASFRSMRDSGVPGGYVPETWSAMVDMGWTGILVPEAHGGSDLGYLTFGLILEQTGRQLTASPLFASAFVGASALLIAGDAAQQERLLPAIVDGSEILTLAVDEGPRHDPQTQTLSAVRSDAGFVLSGAKQFVVEGGTATTLIVAGRAEEGVTLFVVPADAAGVTRTALSMLDSRGYAHIEFDQVEVPAGAVLGELGDGDAVLEQLLDCARAGLTAEMLGTAAQAFDMTLDYLKTREQFGRVIGSFQALGHRAADLFSQMELARSCSEAALSALDSGSEDVPRLASLAKARVGDFLHDMSNQLIQIHGGIGMTDEFDAGLYLKRARTLEGLYGNPAFHRDRYARLLGF